MGGLRAKDNEGIIGSAFRLSIYPYFWLTPSLQILLSSSQEGWLVMLSSFMLTGGAEGQAIPSPKLYREGQDVDGRQKTVLILELGLPAQSSHLSRRLQETAGSYDEKRRNGKFNVGCRGKRETDLPQCNGPDPDRLDIVQ